MKPHLYFHGGRWHVTPSRHPAFYQARRMARLPFTGYSSFASACESARWRWQLAEQRRANPTLTG